MRADVAAAVQRGNGPSPGGGVGLSLAIAHHIVHAHGGAIGVEEGEAGGSRFWFTLPTPRPEEPGGSESRESPRS